MPPLTRSPSHIERGQTRIFTRKSHTCWAGFEPGTHALPRRHVPLSFSYDNFSYYYYAYSFKHISTHTCLLTLSQSQWRKFHLGPLTLSHTTPLTHSITHSLSHSLTFSHSFSHSFSPFTLVRNEKLCVRYRLGNHYVKLNSLALQYFHRAG